MAKDFTHEGVNYRARITAFTVNAEKHFAEVSGEVVDRGEDRTVERFNIYLAGDDFLKLVTLEATAGEMAVDFNRRALWEVMADEVLIQVFDTDEAPEVAVTDGGSSSSTKIKEWHAKRQKDKKDKKDG